MKKSLLFVAAMFAAVCANAQGTWNAVASDAAVDAVVATAGELTQVGANDVQNATIYLLDGGSNWTVKSDITLAETFESNGKTFSKAYIQGGTNGMAGSLDKAGSTSAHVQFTPAVAGKVYVAAKYGKNKPIWAAKVPASVIEAEELDYADMSAYATSVWGQYITADGGLAAEQTVTDADVYAALAYDVEPGNTYFFWVSSSKIMLCGITFETGSTEGISEISSEKVNVNAPAYNLVGQRVAKNAKGLVIINGKKFINK